MAWWQALSFGRGGGPKRDTGATRTFSSGTFMPLSLLAEQMATTDTTKVSRSNALSVPAVARGRNLICSIATLPLQAYRVSDNEVQDNPLLRQMDLDVPNVVHLSQTVEDLIFEAVSYWVVTSSDFNDFPLTVRRVEPTAVSFTPPSDRSLAPLPSGLDPRDAPVWVDGKPVAAKDIIIFHSPNPPVLTVGARAIKRAILLDKAAKMYADDPQATMYFEPAPNAAELSDDQIAEFLADWQAARKRRSVGWKPAFAQLQTLSSPSPRDLQLVELQKQAGLEIANLFGVDPEDLGISTTSRTYANNVDRRRDRINDVLAPYMRAITDRLSMGDVTKRGYLVRFNLDDYLKSNPTERANVQKTYQDMGVLTKEEIRAAEGLTPLPAPEPVDTPTPDTLGALGMVAIEPFPLTTGKPAQHTFSAGLTFVDIPLERFSVDTESRTITGVAVTYATSAKGVRFERGSLKYSDLGRVKLLRDHDSLQPLGVATDFKDGPNGLVMKFRVARGPAGDAALALAEDGVLDGLSVGVDFGAQDTISDPRHRGGVLVRRADLREVSLTAMPAFDDARVTKVAASQATMEVGTVPEVDINGRVTLTEVSPDQGAQDAPAAPADGAQASAPAAHQFTDSERTALLSLLSSQNIGNAQRQFVDPRRGPAVVREAPVYRFNRNGTLVSGSHDLAADLFAWDKMHDVAAYQRAMAFMRAQFADDPISLADVDELNPTINQNRYVDEREFAYPLWSRLGRGAPPNGVQPFQWPKFLSSGITVATHVTGTDPDSKDYQTDKQTVTPTAKSGRVQIPRETWDMGGQPGISDLIWKKVVRAWGEAREAVIDAALDAQAGSMTALNTFTTGGGTGKATLVAEMTAGLTSLQYARGGNRFGFAATHIDLLLALMAAVDTTGRPVYPILNPMNANGTADGGFAGVNVGGIPFVPNIAGDATGVVAANSYLIDPLAVDAWSTEPQRIDITHSVSYIDLGIWGYMAAAVNDLPGTRKIAYDPA